VADGHRVTVVNPESFFQYQPFLPEVASGTIDPRAAVVPLRRVLRHCRLVIGEVSRIDHGAREAHVRTATGAEGNTFAIFSPIVRAWNSSSAMRSAFRRTAFARNGRNIRPRTAICRMWPHVAIIR